MFPPDHPLYDLIKFHKYKLCKRMNCGFEVKKFKNAILVPQFGLNMWVLVSTVVSVGGWDSPRQMEDAEGRFRSRKAQPITENIFLRNGE